MEKERIIVTSALPYANGPIHFGHIAGAYLPADVFVRFKKLCKVDVIYICGTDEHGVPITLSAEQKNITPKEWVDESHKIIKGIFDNFNIEFDNFSRTTKPIHAKLSKEFFLDLYENGFIKENISKQFYCKSCDKFLADRYIEGTCYKCGAENARGDECQSCGAWLEALELKEPKCKLCGSTPIIKETKHWFLQLQDLSKKLEKWIDSKDKWKDNVKKFVKSWIKEGLHERAITRDLKWGIPVPLDNAEGKVLYVWFDAPIGYISSTIEWAEKLGKPDKWKDYWLNEKTKLVHFIGKDNIPFHCITWPSMIMGQNRPYILPEDVPSNEFYNLEGKQFSKSAGWYIELDDFFQKYKTDSIRYSIAANAPETKDSEFTWKDFQLRNNSELANIYGNMVNRTVQFIKKYMDNKIPKSTELTKLENDAIDRLYELFENIKECYENYEVRKASVIFMDIARLGNKYYDTAMPWQTRKDNMEYCNTTINICCEILKVLAYSSYPIIPESSEKLWNMLGFDKKLTEYQWEEIKELQICVGNELDNIEILFEKIDNKIIEEEVKKMNERFESLAEKEYEPIKDQITYEDFSKLDIRCGKILSAEKIKKSKKLFKLIVDIGNEKRQIIAGLAEYYKVDEITGKDVLVLVNLKPAKLMGNESQGMVLAVTNSKGVFAISPPDNSLPGNILS